MPREQILMGLTTAALCGAGLYGEGWLLTETRKGQKLVAACGADMAVWILRGLLTAGIVFGVLLATGIVNPIRW